MTSSGSGTGAARSGRERVRRPAVAGSFYPSDPEELRAEIGRAFDAARRTAPASRPPKALVVPHAGYRYSGPVAASAYRTLESPARGAIRRVVVLGPSHFVPLEGLAVSEADAFETPLGLVPVDDEARGAALGGPRCVADDEPHATEHSLEVQLPFLQTVLDEFTLVPLTVGRAEPEEVAAVLERLWGGPETLVMVSTDLSHYLDHASATNRDRRTAGAIVAGRPEEIADLDACGVHPLRGLLVSVARHGLTALLLDLRTSGDTTGDTARVVGYGAFAFAPG